MARSGATHFGRMIPQMRLDVEGRARSNREQLYFFRPADLVVFYDKRFPADPGTGENGIPAVNRVAIVIDERGALFLGQGVIGRRVERLPLQSIPTAPNAQIRRLTHGYTDQVAQFFARHAHRPTHFEAGLRALLVENLQPLLAGTFFPSRPTYQTDYEYEAAWHHLVANLMPMDAIFTLDLHSRLSRFIAWATDGAWSHVATHIGDGEIWESVISGIRNAHVGIYKGQRYRVAAYRHYEVQKKPRSIEDARTAVRAIRFRPNAYNYRGALKFGWKAFRGDHGHGLTPNSGILQGIWILIAQA